jgi:hypothetical protein
MGLHRAVAAILDPNHGGIRRKVVEVYPAGPGKQQVARMSTATCGMQMEYEIPDVAEFIIGRAFARPVGSSGLRLLR